MNTFVTLWRAREGGEIVDEAAIRAAHPLTVFPLPFAPQPELYEPVHDLPVPEHDPLTHFVVWGEPALMDGQWQRSADVLPLPEDEAKRRQIAARRALVPVSVTRAQGKIALAQLGLWAGVSSFAASIQDPVQRMIADVSLNDAQEWRRDSPFFEAFAQATGMDEQALDGVFITASQVIV